MSAIIDTIVSPINLTAEIENFNSLKKEYNNKLFDLFKNKKKTKTKSKVIISTISDFSKNIDSGMEKYPTIEVNTPLVFKEQCTNDSNQLIIESHDRDKLLFRKTINIKKGINPELLVKKINNEIFNSFIVLELKDLADTMNILNNKNGSEFILDNNGENLHSDKVNDRLEKLEIKFNELKKVYNELYSKKNNLINAIKDEQDKHYMMINKINQDEIINMIEYSRLYFRLFSEDTKILDKTIFKKYIQLQKTLDTLYGKNRNIDIGRLVQVEYEDGSKVISIIQKIISADKCITTPIFSGIQIDTNIQTSSVVDFPKIVTKNSLIGLRQIKKDIEKNNLNILSNSFEPSVRMQIFFEGTNYQSVNPNYFNNKKIAKQIDEQRVHHVLKISGKRDIDYINYSASKLIVSINAQDLYPGEYIRESLNQKDIDEGNFSRLIGKDWRKKLSDKFINSKIDILGKKIVPITIDNLMFPSVEHYYYYSKYTLARNLRSSKRKQYDIHAQKFTISEKNVDKYLSISELSYCGNMMNVKALDNKTLDEVFKKAIYAKFIQDHKLKKILLDTHDALLIQPKKEINGLTFRQLDELMEIRYLIVNDLEPYFYTNYREDIERSKQNNKLISLFFQKKMQELKKLENKTETFNKIMKTNVKDIKFSSIDESVRSNMSYGSTLSKKSKLNTMSEMKDIQTRTLILNYGSKAVSRMSSDEKTKAINDLIQKLKQGYNKKESNIERVSENLQKKGFSTFDVPGDGDCLFTAIVHGLFNENLEPMDFTKSNSFDQQVLIASTSEDFTNSFYKNASIDCRNVIASVLEENFKSKDMNITLQQYISSTIEDTEKYISDLRLSASSNMKKVQNGKLGMWGGYLEILAASAIFNVNFRIIDSTGAENFINPESARTSLPLGIRFNLDSEPKTIVLGFTGSHYLLGLQRDDMLGGNNLINSLHKLNLYVVSTKSFNKKIYPMAVLEVENNFEILGVMNEKENKITYTLGNDNESKEIMADLANKTIKYLNILIENDSINKLSKKILWRDELSNKLYDSNLNLLGKVVNKEDINTGDSYIEFKFN